MKPRILIIEDDGPSSYLFRLLLENEGFAVRTVADGAGGLRALAEELPDLVVMDYQLPDQNACELVRSISPMLQAENISVLIVSANLSIPEECRSVLRAHGCSSLQKPIDPDAFVSKIRDLVEKRTS